MRSTYSIKLELLLDLRIKVGRVNMFGLKLNLSIILKIYSFRTQLSYKLCLIYLKSLFIVTIIKLQFLVIK